MEKEPKFQAQKSETKMPVEKGVERSGFFKKAQKIFYRKLLTMAMVGIVTLGGGLTEQLKADQAKIYKQEGGAAKIMLVNESQEKSGDFLKRLQTQDPETYKWQAAYVKEITRSFERLLDAANEYQEGSTFDKEQEASEYKVIDDIVEGISMGQGLKAQEKEEVKKVFRKRAQAGFEFDHETLVFLKNAAPIISEYKQDLPKIMAYYLELMPTELRQEVIQDVKVPDIKLQIHQPLSFSHSSQGLVASGQTWLNKETGRPEILLHPSAFQDRDTFYTLVSHELVHALAGEQPSLQNLIGRLSKMENLKEPFIREVFKEGAVQNYTLEIMQKLQQEKPDLLIAPNKYNQEVIIASFLTGLLKSNEKYKPVPDLYLRGDIGDREILNFIKDALNELGFPADSQSRAVELLRNNPDTMPPPLLKTMSEEEQKNPNTARTLYTFETMWHLMRGLDMKPSSQGLFMNAMLQQNRRFITEPSNVHLDYLQFQLSFLQQKLLEIKNSMPTK